MSYSSLNSKTNRVLFGRTGWLYCGGTLFTKISEQASFQVAVLWYTVSMFVT